MQREIKVVFRQKQFEQLSNHLYERTDVESMAIGFYNISESLSVRKLLVRNLAIPTNGDYHDRKVGYVSLKPEFIESCFQYCEKHNCHIFDIHTHPWADNVSFSSIDDNQAIKNKIPYQEEYVSKTSIAFMVFGKNLDRIQARIWDKANHTFQYIPLVIIL